jgi:hypothetical protein
MMIFLELFLKYLLDSMLKLLSAVRRRKMCVESEMERERSAKAAKHESH